jgi:hypothetical protein
MVQIPEFKSKTTPTSQTGTRARPVVDVTSAAQAPFEGLMGLASDVQKVSTRFYEAQKSLQRKTETSELVDYLIKGDDQSPGLNKLMFDAKSNPNTNTALPNFEKSFQNHRNTIASGIKDNVVKTLFNNKADELYTNNYIDVQSAVWKNVRENSVKTLNNNIELEFNQYLNAGGNTAKKNTSLANIEKLILDANNDGLGLPEDYSKTQIDSLYTLEADRLATDNPELFLQNLDNGYYNDKIDPENLNTLYKSAQSKILTQNKKSISNIKAEGKNIKSDVNELIDIMNSEAFNISTYNNLMTKALQNHEIQIANGLEGIPNVIEDLQIAKYGFDVVQQAKTSTPDDVKSLIDNVKLQKERLSKDPNATIFEQKALITLEEKLGSIHSKMLTESKDDILNMAESFDPAIQIAELNLFETDTQSFYNQSEKRHTQANEIADFYNQPVQYLKKEEKEGIKKILNNGTYEEIQSVLTNLTILGKEDSKQIFVNLGLESEAPVLTHLGLLIYNNNGKMTATTDAILSGIIASRSDNTKDNFKIMKSKMSDASALATVMSDYLQPSLQKNMTNTMSQIEQSAEYIFMDKISRNENDILNANDKEIKQMYEESIQIASGLHKRNNNYYGGFQDFGDGNKIILPQNMPNGNAFTLNNKKNTGFATMKELLQDRITPELLEKSLTFESDIFDTGTNKTVTQKNTILPFDSETGLEMKIEDFFEPDIDSPWYKMFFDDDGEFYDDVFFETAGDGVYYFGIGNPNSSESQYFLDKDGKEVIINIKNILPELLDGLV